jgi:hypothetical protein
MAKVKLDSHLYDRAKAAAETAGYSSVDEFIIHVIEKELANFESQEGEDEQVVQDRLRGLGYIE